MMSNQNLQIASLWSKQPDSGCLLAKETPVESARTELF